MKIIINGLLLLIVTTIYSQNTVEGIVTDSNSNTPIPFANIYLPLLEKGAITDNDGKFIISNLPTGNYKILISIIGYKTLSIEIDIPLIQDLNIKLTSSVIEMEQIIISTPFHKLQSENVMKVEREKVSDLKEKGAVTLSEGITNIPGVESVTTGLSIGKPVIRGLSSNRVVIYTQGVRLENQQFGSEHGLGVSDAGVESVEVIKGPASLLYGSDALGGVLYLNPEKFATKKTSSGDVNFNYFSNTKGYSTNAGFKSSATKFKYIIRGSLAEHSDYKTKDYRVTNTRFKEQDIKAALGYQNKAFKTEVRYNINNLKTGIPEEIGLQSSSKRTLIPYQKVSNQVLSSKTKFFFNKSSLNINAGYIFNDRKEFEEFTTPVLGFKLKTVNYDVKYDTPKLGKFETIVGVQGMKQKNINYGVEQLIPDATTNDIGFFTVSHIHFNNYDIQLGARYDKRNIDVKNSIDKTYNSFNSAFGIKFNLFKKITTRLNFATGFRAPNLAELTSNGVHEGTNRFEIGNPNLNSEQNFQTDLAYEYKNEHFEVFANVFYNKINDYIFISPTENIIEDNFVFVYEQNDAKLYGGEFGVHIHPHPLDWLHFESSFETVNGKKDKGEYLPLIPASSVSNIFRVEFNNTTITKGYAFVKLKTVFNQNRISSFETRTSGYNLLSAGFGGKIKLAKHELSISLSGTNLTNKKYINHLSRLKTDNIFNIGRNLSIGLSYNL
jgi:iron complex outermembrane recepter protein